MQQKENIIGPSFHQREYSIEGIIGKGSFGQVYKVRQEEGKFFSPALQNKLLALKMYHYSHASFQRPILDEVIHMMLVARSPYAVDFFDRSPPWGKPEYLVMEYVPETMETRSAQLSEEPTLHRLIHLYLQQMPFIIETLHHAGVVHCDLKPSNIGIKDGHLKLLDLGLARSSTSTGAIPQKRIFYPLEARQGLITPALDVYCAGRILERVLTREYAAQIQQTIETIEFFHDVTLPVSWRKMFFSMLHPDYEKRPSPTYLHQLMADAAQDMDTFLFKDFVSLSAADLLPSSSSFLPC